MQDKFKNQNVLQSNDQQRNQLESNGQQRRALSPIFGTNENDLTGVIPQNIMEAFKDQKNQDLRNNKFEEDKSLQNPENDFQLNIEASEANYRNNRFSNKHLQYCSDDYDILEQNDEIENNNKSNQICAICLSLIKNKEYVNIHCLKLSKYYKCHEKCYAQINEQSQTRLVNLKDALSTTITLGVIQKQENKVKKQSLKAQYEINFYHMISSAKIYQFSRMGSIQEIQNKSNGYLEIDLNAQKNYLYQPLCLILPFEEFRMSISVQQMQPVSQDEPLKQYEAQILVDVSSLKNDNNFQLKSENNDLVISLQAILLNKSQQEILNMTNYKFPDQWFELDEKPTFIKINMIQIQIVNMFRKKLNKIATNQNFELQQIPNQVQVQQQQQNKQQQQQQVNSNSSPLTQQQNIFTQQQIPTQQQLQMLQQQKLMQFQQLQMQFGQFGNSNQTFSKQISSPLSYSPQTMSPSNHAQVQKFSLSPQTHPRENPILSQQFGQFNLNSQVQQQPQQQSSPLLQSQTQIFQQKAQSQQLLQQQVSQQINQAIYNKPEFMNFQQAYEIRKMSLSDDHSPSPVEVSPKLNYINSPKSNDEEIPPGLSEINTIDDIKGKINQFVRTQHGSRLIQKLFTKCSQQDLDYFIKEIETNLADLMMDNYANYMFGSLSQSCSPNQRLLILKIIAPKLVEIACDKKGTHALQALVSLINCKQEEDLIKNTIQNNVLQLTLDNQGTHLIKKIITRFSDENVTFIFNSLLPNFIDIVNHQAGLCVLKDIMTRFKNDQTKKMQIISLIDQNIDQIVQNPYGNYAIQHIIDTYEINDYTGLIDKILSKVLQLSNQKFSSNVVEKCLLYTNQEVKNRFIKQISQEEITLELMKNKYGNFVLQKAINASDSTQFQILMQSIAKNLQHVHTPQYHNKWQEYLEKIFHNNQQQVPSQQFGQQGGFVNQ